MKKINISFQIDLETHSNVKKAAKSQDMSLQAYFIELHNKHIQGTHLFDHNEFLMQIYSNGKKGHLLQYVLMFLVGIYVPLIILYGYIR